MIVYRYRNEKSVSESLVSRHPKCIERLGCSSDKYAVNVVRISEVLLPRSVSSKRSLLGGCTGKDGSWCISGRTRLLVTMGPIYVAAFLRLCLSQSDTTVRNIEAESYSQSKSPCNLSV